MAQFHSLLELRECGLQSPDAVATPTQISIAPWKLPFILRSHQLYKCNYVIPIVINHKDRKEIVNLLILSSFRYM
jgi:hypothetical protein